MSSLYRVLCLSHDPATVAADEDWQSGAGGLERAVAAAQQRQGDLAEQHPNCDLVVGRYSYPLIEVACVGGCRHPHPGPAWVDDDLLRIAWRGHTTDGDPALKKLVESSSSLRCWPYDRLNKLRVELNLR